MVKCPSFDLKKLRRVKGDIMVEVDRLIQVTNAHPGHSRITNTNEWGQ